MEWGIFMLRNAIEVAIKMETDAIAFYRDAVRKTKHPFGKEMFRGFIKDETRHLKMLKGIFKGLEIDSEFVRPKKTIKTVFTKLKGRMMDRVEALESEIDAVGIALKFESSGYEYYQKAAVKAPTKKERDLFKRLAVEENDHYTILLETKHFLENTGQWYMYEERGIVEG